MSRTVDDADWDVAIVRLRLAPFYESTQLRKILDGGVENSGAERPKPAPKP